MKTVTRDQPAWSCLFCDATLKTNNAGRHYGKHQDANHPPQPVTVTICGCEDGYTYVVTRDDKTAPVAAPRPVVKNIETAVHRAEVWLSGFGEIETLIIDSISEVQQRYTETLTLGRPTNSKTLAGALQRRGAIAPPSPMEVAEKALAVVLDGATTVPIGAVGDVAAWLEDTATLVESLR